MNKKCTLLITYKCNLNCVYCYERHKSKATMSFETARSIIKKELNSIDNYKYDCIDFHFLGGEPLLNFNLIREVCEWTWEKKWSHNFHFYVITNGTLLDSSRRLWFESHRKQITIDISVDGIDSMQYINRGCSMHELPIEWVHKYWPNSRFKMTISKQTLPKFAYGVIGLVSKGYDVSSSLAIGEKWTKNDVDEYRFQWNRLLNHFLNLNKGPIWKQLLKSIDPLFDNSFVQEKCCGAGDSAITYDINGECYPCVIFTPLVSGIDMRNQLKGVSFDNPTIFADPECSNCFIRNMCKTCYGFNLQERGNLASRDKSVCAMFHVEIHAICMFQRELLQNIAKIRNLSKAEIHRLQKANDASIRLCQQILI